MSQTTSSFNSASATWEEHRSAFFKAIRQGDMQTLDTVLTKYPEAVSWQDQKGQRPLHLAFENKNHDVFVYLLENKSDPNQESPEASGWKRFFSEGYSYSILQKAIFKGDKSYIMPLLQHGADTRFSSGQGAPRDIRYEIDDLLKRADRIRAEFEAAQKNPAAFAAPAPQAVTAADNPQEIEVLKPVRMKNRSHAQTP